jgi:hypothetical protein
LVSQKASFETERSVQKLSAELEDLEARAKRNETSLQNIHTLLMEIRDNQELEKKSRAWILQEISKLNDKVDTIQDIVSRRFRTQNDAAVARRERTWN